MFRFGKRFFVTAVCALTLAAPALAGKKAGIGSRSSAASPPAINSSATQVDDGIQSGPVAALTADLSVHATALAPFQSGAIPEGVSVQLGIEFENDGPVASNGTASYTLSCQVLQGAGPCPLPIASTGPVPVIPPSQTRSVFLVGATPSVPGKYRLQISVSPSDAHGPAYSRDFEVSSKAKITKIPDAARKGLQEAVPRPIGPGPLR